MSTCLRIVSSTAPRFAALRAASKPAFKRLAPAPAWTRPSHYSSSSLVFGPPSVTHGINSLRTYSSSTIRREAAPTDALQSQPESESPAQRTDVPAYHMTFTCKPCKTRSSHHVSKQGYHHGTVLITCPNCKNRHLISDHLKIFDDNRMTIDRFLEENGETVRRGALGPDGNIELWDQGTEERGGQYHLNTTSAEESRSRD